MRRRGDRHADIFGHRLLIPRFTHAVALNVSRFQCGGHQRRRCHRQLDLSIRPTTNVGHIEFDGKLGNPNFIDKAPEAVVAKERARQEELQREIGQLGAQVAKLAELE